MSSEEGVEALGESWMQSISGPAVPLLSAKALQFGALKTMCAVPMFSHMCICVYASRMWMRADEGACMNACTSDLQITTCTPYVCLRAW